MLIGITARMRNGAMLKYREKYGLTQKAAADLAGINPTTWCAMELLRFDGWMGWPAIKRIADFLGVEPDEICPEEFRGTNLSAKRLAYREVEAKALLAAACPLALPSLMYDDVDLKDEVRCAMESLTEREKAVITRRFGLDGNPPQTLLEIGKLFHLTRERIRSIEAKAIRRMQHPAIANKLATLLDDCDADSRTAEVAAGGS